MDGGDNSRDYILDQYLPNIEIKMETSIKGSLAIFWVALILENQNLLLIGLFKWHHDLRIKKFKLNEKLHKRDLLANVQGHTVKKCFFGLVFDFFGKSRAYIRGGRGA